MSGVCVEFDRSEYGSLDIEDGPVKYHSVRPSVDTKTKAGMSWKGNAWREQAEVEATSWQDSVGQERGDGPESGPTLPEIRRLQQGRVTASSSEKLKCK